MATRIKANPTVIGAFVLGALALVATAIILLGGAAIFTPKQRAVVFFEGSVNGLSVGAPVNFRGVRVGSVDRIALQFDAATLNARIPVYLTLLPNQVHLIGSKGTLKDLPFANFIEKGLRAKLNLESIVTGQLAVDLDFRPDTPALLVGSPDPSIPEIPAAKSDFDVLKEQLSQIPFRALADDIHRAVDAVHTMSEGSNATLNTLNGEVKITAAETRATLKQLQATLAGINQTATAATQTLNTLGPELSQTMAKAQTAFDHADGTMARMDSTFNQVTELTAPGAPLRLNLEQTLHDLSESAESLRSFADTVERNPNALVFGKDK